MNNTNAWAITFKSGKEKERILLGLIYPVRQDAVDYFKKTKLYKPEHKIRRIKIKIVK